MSTLKWCGPIHDAKQTYMLSIYASDPFTAVEIITDLNGNYIKSDLVNLEPGTWSPTKHKI